MIILSAWSFLQAQDIDFNTPVSESGNMTCTIVTPLSATPSMEFDFLNWPTVAVGSKYEFGDSENEDSDKRSIILFTGENEREVEITVETETMKDNVEISFTFRGTANPQIGQPLSAIPVLYFNNGKEIVSLSTEGKYYLHIIYNWVWAHENATTGVKTFVQRIKVQYHNI